MANTSVHSLAAAQAVDASARRWHAWRAVAIAAVLGFVVGLLVEG